MSPSIPASITSRTSSSRATTAPRSTSRSSAWKGFDKKIKTVAASYQDFTDELLEKYKARLNYEIDVIKKTGFASYFLIVSDFIGYAKSQDIPVGPGRGSAAGSLVAYCLDITEYRPHQVRPHL